MKIPSEYFADVMEMVSEVVMGVVDKEVFKVADMVVDMEVVKVADMVVEKEVEKMKIPNEDFIDMTLAISDTYGSDVGGGGHRGWRTKWIKMHENGYKIWMTVEIYKDG